MVRQGKNGDSYINQIRSRAKVSNFTNASLDMILAERGREMFCEGHRRWDLIGLENSSMDGGETTIITGEIDISNTTVGH